MRGAEVESQVFGRRSRRARPGLRALVSSALVALTASCVGSVPDDGGDGAGGAASGRVSCDPRSVLCRRAPPICDEGEVPSVVGRCYGECVPIEQCGCTGPEACPFPETYTCFLDRQHCGPYVR
jgi:hypothetical protein